MNRRPAGALEGDHRRNRANAEAPAMPGCSSIFIVTSFTLPPAHRGGFFENWRQLLDRARTRAPRNRREPAGARIRVMTSAPKLASVAAVALPGRRRCARIGWLVQRRGRIIPAITSSPPATPPEHCWQTRSPAKMELRRPNRNPQLASSRRWPARLTPPAGRCLELSLRTRQSGRPDSERNFIGIFKSDFRQAGIFSARPLWLAI